MIRTESRSEHIRRGTRSSRAPRRRDSTEEIAQSQEVIAGWIARPVRAFAYPNGRKDLDYSPETVGILARLGFDAAFTMQQSFAGPREPALERSRFMMLASITAAELAHRLAYTWPR